MSLAFTRGLATGPGPQLALVTRQDVGNLNRSSCVESARISIDGDPFSFANSFPELRAVPFYLTSNPNYTRSSQLPRNHCCVRSRAPAHRDQCRAALHQRKGLGRRLHRKQNRGIAVALDLLDLRAAEGHAAGGHTATHRQAERELFSAC